MKRIHRGDAESAEVAENGGDDPFHFLLRVLSVPLRASAVKG